MVFFSNSFYCNIGSDLVDHSKGVMDTMRMSGLSQNNGACFLSIDSIE